MSNMPMFNILRSQEGALSKMAVNEMSTLKPKYILQFKYTAFSSMRLKHLKFIMT